MQNNVGFTKVVKTNKLLDNTKPKYANTGKCKPWQRGTDKRQQVENNK